MCLPTMIWFQIFRLIFKIKKYFFYKWNLNRYYHFKSVDLGVMAMKRYITLPQLLYCN